MILYHHEHADGTGPFQKKWNETPLPARIIHLADTVDIIGNSIKSDDNRWDFICQYLSQKRIVYLIQNVLMLFFMYSQKNPICV